jgi:hypothetical protein
MTVAEKSHIGVANRASSTHRPDRTIVTISMYNASEDAVRLRALELFDRFVSGNYHFFATVVRHRRLRSDREEVRMFLRLQLCG